METKEQLLKAIRDAARKAGTKSLTKREFVAAGGGMWRVDRHFPSWVAACAAAGLVPNKAKVRVPDEEIFPAMRDALLKCGGLRSKKQFARHFRYNMSTFHNRGWSWDEAMVALRTWLEAKEPRFPFLDQLPFTSARRADRQATWRSLGGRTCGEPLAFRGFLHAPTNEIGAAMLFAIIAPDLGYVIESTQSAFPDCQAKRHIGNGRWEHVRIEFEFRSRNFVIHKHNRKKCDVIVCWEHNWPRCPLEVIELKKEIEKLRKKG